MEFLEAPAFTRYVFGYLTDDEYREVQNRLAAAPEHGDVIPGRISEASLDRPKTWQRTKRRSARDLLLLHRRAKIWVITCYDKDEASDLTPKERHALKSAVEIELRARQAAKLARQRKSRR